MAYSMNAAVELGVQLLDECDPGWLDRVDLAMLNMEFHRLCLLSQLYGSFDEGIERLDLASPFGDVQDYDGWEYGFTLPLPLLGSLSAHSTYAQLTERWHTIIEEKRRSLKVQEMLHQLYQAATALYDLHQRYIPDAWGTFRHTGETYREKGGKEWVAVQRAFLTLEEQAKRSGALVDRTSLDGVLYGMQGHNIRLLQRYAETPDDPSLYEDKTRVSHLWQELNRIHKDLYQHLG